MVEAAIGNDREVAGEPAEPDVVEQVDVVLACVLST
jgi:hypothetical protein